MTEPKHPKFEAFKAERLQNPAVREAYEASKASEPKHIPLTARLREYADAMAEEFRRVLQTPDDALVEFGDDPTEEEYR